MNWLRSIVSDPAEAQQLPRGYQYAYNAANQRTEVTLADGSSWDYGYDRLGQVTSGKKFLADGTPVPGQQFEYGFDELASQSPPRVSCPGIAVRFAKSGGNRLVSRRGGDLNGNALRETVYESNGLNQYSRIEQPGYVEVMGIAAAGASVTMNGSGAVDRKGEYFRKELAVNNSSAAQWVAVSASASDGTNTSPAITGNVYLPKKPGAGVNNILHDLDGNLTQDGRWSHTWDAENRLVKLESLEDAPVGSRRKLEFKYDWRGRRIYKKVTNLDTAQVIVERKYVYDGWNLLAELDGSGGLVQTYVWGLDLSGSMQGAGGVGGLLGVKPAGGPVHFAAYDGNGNVTDLVNGSDGTISAHYEYGAFGEPIRVTGPMGEANPFRFSTKYTDEESGHLYYGYRYYDPITGRWLNRDPIEEEGGLDLYTFVRNDGVSGTDVLGLLETGRKIHRAATECEADPTAKFRPFKSGITIVAGHAYFTDVDSGEIIPAGGLINEAKLHLELQKQGRLGCQKFCYVGCKSGQLNEAAVNAGIGIPGMEGNFHPRNILPGEANRDLLLTGLLNSRIRQALQRARAEARQICAKNKCVCKVITINVTCEGVESSLCGHKEQVSCK